MRREVYASEIAYRHSREAAVILSGEQATFDVIYRCIFKIPHACGNILQFLLLSVDTFVINIRFGFPQLAVLRKL